MATVTGYTAEKMDEIRDATIVDAAIVADELILTKYDGSVYNLGVVVGADGADGADGATGPQGPAGPAGGSSWPDGTVGAPGGYFTNDTDTGVMRPASNQLRVVAGAQGIVDFAYDGTTKYLYPTVTDSVHLGWSTLGWKKVWAAHGSASAPSYGFVSDTGLGFYRVGANQIGVAISGVLSYQFGSTFLNSGGNAGSPAYSFLSDPDSGMFSGAANQLNFATGGTSVFSVAHTGTYIGLVPSADDTFKLGHSSYAWKQLFIDAGTSANPSVCFLPGANDGFWRDASGLNSNYGGSHLTKLNVSMLSPALSLDNNLLLGNSNARWSVVYAGTGTINTSDESLKTDVSDLEHDLDFIMAIRPIKHKWEDGKRFHYSFSAQQVKEAMTQVGISDFAGYIDPSFEANARVNPYSGTPSQEFMNSWMEDRITSNTSPSEFPRMRLEAANEWNKSREAFDAETESMRNSPLGLRYIEFIPPIVGSIQKVNRKTEDLERRIAALEAA